MEAVTRSPVVVLGTAVGSGPDRLCERAHASKQTRPRDMIPSMCNNPPPPCKYVHLWTNQCVQTKHHLRLIFEVFSLFSVNQY